MSIGKESSLHLQLKTFLIHLKNKFFVKVFFQFQVVTNLTDLVLFSKLAYLGLFAIVLQECSAKN